MIIRNKRNNLSLRISATKEKFNSYRVYFTAILLLILSNVSGQSAKEISPSLPNRQIRGYVTDQFLQSPVEGATVTLPGFNKTVITNSSGEFRFDSIPVGVQQLRVSHVSYKELSLDNIVINTGKETVLNIAIESNVRRSDTLFVKATRKKNKPLNEMSAVSVRAFSVEEAQKYAAAVNDPSRMATGFPGVITADDGNNNIVIRGNSPTGLLWRMEGIEIPNPNHFASTGSSGGGISILSAQLLSNSDFITGAFAAEYGNALSGVFDLKLRKGNNEKKEYTLQAGVLGLNATAEGPLMSFYKGSYLVNYRYSTLGLLNKLGVTLNSGTTNFQDISYNVYLPTKRMGTFTLFGFGGLSSEDVKAKMDSSKWKENKDRYTSKFISNTGAAGITHAVSLAARTSLRSAIAFSYNKIAADYQYVRNDYSLTEEYIDDFKTKKWTASSTLNHKFNSKFNLRAGLIISMIGFDYYQKSKENDSASLKEVINTKDHTQTIQGFSQWQYKVNRLTFSAGLHYLQLLYNNTNSFEPRGAVKWEINKRNSLAFGYGRHSQVQSMGVYFAQVKNNNDQIIYPNKNLGLTKASHYILSYQRALATNLALKAELYYQQLFNVPVSSSDTSSFSILNVQSEYITDPLRNKGRGKNYGVEISLEKYLANYFYYTLSTSLYQSKYTGADGIERDTRFNGNRIVNLVAGKEFLSRDKRGSFSINIKAIHAGGLRTTPVDIARSIQVGYAVYKENESFTLQNPGYFRLDIRLAKKWNRKRVTSILSLDIQNVTNRLNIYGQSFNAQKGKLENIYQNGLIPILNYKIEF